MDGLHQRLANFFVRDLDSLWHSGHQVAALDLHRLDFIARIRGTDRYLDELGSPLTDQQVILALDVLDYGFIHLVAGYSYRAREDHARERNHRDFSGAAADI